VWPFFVYFATKKRLPYIALGLIILAPILRVLATPYDTWHWFIYKGTPFRMDLLATGALLTFVWRAHADKIKRFGYLGLIFPLLTPLIMMKLSRIGGFSTMDGTVRGNLFTYEIALFAAAGTFLWALGGRFTWILKTFPMQWLGRISYSCYLIHTGALIWADQHISRHGLAVAAAATGTLVYSLLSWFWMEKPILNAGNRRVARIEVESATA
jgi:peptidoglycan/LPS O-acetylase OafA/YrhL